MKESESIRMTDEEMIDTLKGLVFGSFDRTTAKEREALNLVIQKLEQQSVIDKIRAEIEAEPYISKMEVLDIIDKYIERSESE